MSDQHDPTPTTDGSSDPAASSGDQSLRDPFDESAGTTPRERSGLPDADGDADPSDQVSDGATAREVLEDIAADPVAFGSNLAAAAVEGGGTFAKNIVSHMSHGINDWIQETVGGEQNLGDVDAPSDDGDDGDDGDGGGGSTMSEYGAGFEVGDRATASDPAVYIEEVPSGVAESGAELADPFDDPMAGGAHLGDDAGL